MPLPSSIVAALVVLGAAAGFAHLADDTPAAAQDAPAVTVVAPAYPSDHRLEEDEPGWNCATMGNRSCLPNNAAQAPTQEQEADAAYAAAQVRTVAATSGGTCSEPAPTAPSHTTATHTPAPQPQPQAGGLVNVNTASVAQLDALPGIGTVLAARIVENRPYSTVDDLHRVARIPFSKVAPLVTV